MLNINGAFRPLRQLDESREYRECILYMNQERSSSYLLRLEKEVCFLSRNVVKMGRFLLGKQGVDRKRSTAIYSGTYRCIAH